MNAIRIVDKKLRRRNALGMAHPDTRTIEIDPRLEPQKRLEIMLHEAMHIVFEFMDEATVDASAKELADVLWRDGWRRA